MKLTTPLILTFKNEEGDTAELESTIEILLQQDMDFIKEQLGEEDYCTSSSCNNESQNFCCCPNIYENYELTDIEIKV